jgi:hypothetical protein
MPRSCISVFTYLWKRNPPEGESHELLELRRLTPGARGQGYKNWPSRGRLVRGGGAPSAAARGAASAGPAAPASSAYRPCPPSPFLSNEALRVWTEAYASNQPYWLQLDKVLPNRSVENEESSWPALQPGGLRQGKELAPPPPPILRGERWRWGGEELTAWVCLEERRTNPKFCVSSLEINENCIIAIRSTFRYPSVGLDIEPTVVFFELF